MLGVLHVLTPPKVTCLKLFKTNKKTLCGSPVHTKFKEREKLVLPSFLSPSCSGERIKEVQELGVWNHTELGLNHNSTFTGQLGSGLASLGFSCFTCKMWATIRCLPGLLKELWVMSGNVYHGVCLQWEFEQWCLWLGLRALSLSHVLVFLRWLSYS